MPYGRLQSYLLIFCHALTFCLALIPCCFAKACKALYDKDDRSDMIEEACINTLPACLEMLFPFVWVPIPVSFHSIPFQLGIGRKPTDRIENVSTLTTNYQYDRKYINQS